MTNPTTPYQKARERDEARLTVLKARTQGITGIPMGMMVPMHILRDIHGTPFVQAIFSRLEWHQQVEYGMYNSYRRFFLN